jgi:prepilin peptidase CpaA
MNLIVGAPLWLSLLLIVALAAAAIEDALRLRISNLTCAVVFIGAIVAAALHGFSPSLWQNALMCLAILAVGMPAFAAGWFGGGDVKLLAAIGLWLDLGSAAALIAAVFMAGGIIAALYIAARSWKAARRSSVRRDGKVPYGLAIVAGAFVMFGIQLSETPANSVAGLNRSLASWGSKG